MSKWCQLVRAVFHSRESLVRISRRLYSVFCLRFSQNIKRKMACRVRKSWNQDSNCSENCCWATVFLCSTDTLSIVGFDITVGRSDCFSTSAFSALHDWNDAHFTTALPSRSIIDTNSTASLSALETKFRLKWAFKWFVAIILTRVTYLCGQPTIRVNVVMTCSNVCVSSLYNIVQKMSSLDSSSRFFIEPSSSYFSDRTQYFKIASNTVLHRSRMLSVMKAHCNTLSPSCCFFFWIWKTKLWIASNEWLVFQSTHRMTITEWIASPRFFIATITATATKWSAHFVSMMTMCRLFKTIHAQHTRRIHATITTTIKRLVHFEYASAYAFCAGFIFDFLQHGTWIIAKNKLF